MKKVLLLLAVTLFVGCANKSSLSCPSCNITSSDGNTSFVCTECTVEATASEDFISLPRLGQ